MNTRFIRQNRREQKGSEERKGKKKERSSCKENKRGSLEGWASERAKSD